MEFKLLTRGLGHEIDSIINERPKTAYMVSAFITHSGAEKVIKWTQDSPTTEFKLVTGTYLDFSNPEALVALSKKNIPFRIIDKRSENLHAKAYLFVFEDRGKLIIGSGNLTPAALYHNIEWSGYITEGKLEEFGEFFREFDKLWKNGVELSDEWLETYRLDYRRSNAALIAREDPNGDSPEPRHAQLEALRQLRSLRNRGESKGLVVMATGLGKTHLAAFDSSKYSKVLFLAHRREILNQAKEVFQQVRKTGELLNLEDGWWTIDRADVLFATVQKMGKERNLERFERTHFNYIIVDEFHHAKASNYVRILDHFEPMFLLGLTATPFRMDRKDITALCDYNIPYSNTFVESIDKGWLSPFEYRGVYDSTIDYTKIPWKRNSQYDIEALNLAASTRIRAAMILEKYKEFGSSPAVAFCVSIKHADFMADYFTKEGVPSIAAHSEGAPASEAKYRVRNGEIEVIFAVDIFNEGVDLPAISTVLFLRPTLSLTIFLQQFGRGLRKHEGKDLLTVLDFVGNYKKSFIVPTLLLGKLYPHLGREAYSVVIESIQKKRHFELPKGCSIHFDLELIEIMKESLGVLHPVRLALIQRYFELRKTLGEVPITTLRTQVPSVWNYIIAFGSLYDFYKEVGDLSEAQQGYTEKEIGVLRWIERKEFNTRIPLDILEIIMLSDRTEWDIEEFEMNLEMNPDIDLKEEYELTGVKDITSLFQEWTKETKFGSKKMQSGRSGIEVRDSILLQDDIRWGELYYDIAERLELRREEFRISFQLFEPYSTREIIRILSRELHPEEVKGKLENRMGGIIRFDSAKLMLLFVTLDKNEKDQTMYKDHFTSVDTFEWESQNITTLNSTNGKIITGDPDYSDYRILLMVRLRKNDLVYRYDHFYMGQVRCIEHKDEKPIKVTWKMEQEMDNTLYSYFTSKDYRKYTMPQGNELDLES